MKVTPAPDGPCRQTLQIEVPADDVRPEFENVTAEFMRTARIPGFRPGRAPRPMIERRFAKPIAEQVRDRLVPRFYRQAIEQQEIEPVSIVDLNHDNLPDPKEGLSFKVTVDLPPEFDPPDHKAFELQDQTASVAASDIESGLLNLRRRYAQYPEVERPARDHDLVFFDYDGTIDGAAMADTLPECRELASGRDVAMIMNPEREILPGFHSGLQGVRSGEERLLETVFPSDYAVAAVAGKTVSYRVRVKTVREENLPELDADFFKKVAAADEEDLRRKLHAGLTAAASENEQRRRIDAIVRHLLDNTEMEALPASLLAEENRVALQQMVQDFVRQGVAQDAIAKHRDEIVQTAERTSQERVKLNLILDRIARREKIEATREDFDRYIDDMARRYGITADKALQTIRQNNAIDHLMAQIRRGKTTNFLSENIRIRPADIKAASDSPKKETSIS